MQWHQHDLELMKNGATINALGNFTITAAQEDQLHVQMERELASRDTGKSQMSDSSHNLDNAASERLREYMNYGAISISTWVNSRIGTPREYRIGSNGYTWLADEKIQRKAPRDLKYSTPASTLHRLAHENISELVTARTLQNENYGKIEPGSPKSQEPLVMISYETMAADTRKYPLGNMRSPGATDNSLKVNLKLPQSEAMSLMGDIEKDPNTIRELVDMIMVEKFQIGEGWENNRPPYDEWQQTNGGVNRIGITEGPIRSMQDVRVLEF